ncbi:hypothetical protein JX266_013102 [Neoarthrinium moseri]|nr:hypothetical protein JX266_013102 [Neoarthrinium moseri]
MIYAGSAACLVGQVRSNVLELGHVIAVRDDPSVATLSTQEIGERQQPQRQNEKQQQQQIESPVIGWSQSRSLTVDCVSLTHGRSPASTIDPGNKRQYASDSAFGASSSVVASRDDYEQLSGDDVNAERRPDGAAAFAAPESENGPPNRAQGIVDSTPTPTRTYASGRSNHTALSSMFSTPSMVIHNPKNFDKRLWIWLAPWSAWSSTIRLMAMLRKKVYPDNPSVPANLVNSNVYDWSWKTSTNTELPMSSDLPSAAHAIYLFSAVKFHLDQTYRLFDHDAFESQIHRFYLSPLQTATENRMWFTKFLLILAFGTAFHATPSEESTEPPGAKFFTRAMTLIPDASSLWKDSFIAIEVLALSALYLYSVDEREAAYIQLGHAIRIAQMEGMHTQLPEADLGSDTVLYCRDLWWTLYIMERHFSSSVGLPMSIQDTDITTPVSLPNSGSQVETCRSLQVNLSNLMSVILKTVYKSETVPLGTFIEQTRSILHTLANHASELKRIISLSFHSSVGAVSRRTRYVFLLYHQCVIVATRPLLLSVLKERLDTLGYMSSSKDLLVRTWPVISVGLKSAVKTVEILTSEYSLLEAFLPYDTEFAFAAAVYLTIAKCMFPDVINCQRYMQSSQQVLDDLTSRGNRIARARRAEVDHLERLCQATAVQVGQDGFHALQLHDSDPAGTTDINFARSLSISPSPSPSRHPFVVENMNESASFGPVSSTGDAMDFLNDIGISSDEFHNIVQQIGDPEAFPEAISTLT